MRKMRKSMRGMRDEFKGGKLLCCLQTCNTTQPNTRSHEKEIWNPGLVWTSDAGPDIFSFFVRQIRVWVISTFRLLLYRKSLVRSIRARPPGKNAIAARSPFAWPVRTQEAQGGTCALVALTESPNVLWRKRIYESKKQSCYQPSIDLAFFTAERRRACACSRVVQDLYFQQGESECWKKKNGLVW